MLAAQKRIFVSAGDTLIRQLETVAAEIALMIDAEGATIWVVDHVKEELWAAVSKVHLPSSMPWFWLYTRPFFIRLSLTFHLSHRTRLRA